jgi:hypothetical protein
MAPLYGPKGKWQPAVNESNKPHKISRLTRAIDDRRTNYHDLEGRIIGYCLQLLFCHPLGHCVSIMRMRHVGFRERTAIRASSVNSHGTQVDKPPYSGSYGGSGQLLSAGRIDAMKFGQRTGTRLFHYVDVCSQMNHNTYTI